MRDHDRYAAQSRDSDPGAFTAWVAGVPPELSALHGAANHLVYHYSQRDSFAGHGIGAERLHEIDTRHADEMFRLVHAMSDTPLGSPRRPADRMLGCCRDYTLFLVAMARHHGIPARSRVGFATYFAPGWALDHVVAEIWDAVDGRWRLVDANLDVGHVAPDDGAVLDVLDLPRDRFIVAPEAWRRCRAGEADPERFAVRPDLDEPFLRSWPYLIHDLLTDLAALGSRALVLWDVWGVGEQAEPVSPDQLATLDALAADLLADPTAETIAQWLSHDDLRVPDTVTSWSPATPGSPRSVTLRC